MIIYDEMLIWSGLGHDLINEDGLKSKCRIRIVKLNPIGAVSFLKKYYIVASDLGLKFGTSITNGAQVLIPHVCETHNIDIDEMVWFEHYPHDDCELDPTLDVVVPKPISTCCLQVVSVEWRPARVNEIRQLKQFIPDINITNLIEVSLSLDRYIGVNYPKTAEVEGASPSSANMFGKSKRSRYE